METLERTREVELMTKVLRDAELSSYFIDKMVESYKFSKSTSFDDVKKLLDTAASSIDLLDTEICCVNFYQVRNKASKHIHHAEDMTLRELHNFIHNSKVFNGCLECDEDGCGVSRRIKDCKITTMIRLLCSLSQSTNAKHFGFVVAESDGGDYNGFDDIFVVYYIKKNVKSCQDYHTESVILELTELMSYEDLKLEKYCVKTRNTSFRIELTDWNKSLKQLFNLIYEYAAFRKKQLYGMSYDVHVHYEGWLSMWHTMKALGMTPKMLMSFKMNIARITAPCFWDGDELEITFELAQ